MQNPGMTEVWRTITAVTPIYALIGLAIGCLGYVILKMSHIIEDRCKQKTVGYILDNVSLKERRKTLYYPLVAYEIDGTNYTIQYRLGTKDTKYTPGQTVQIKINPKNHSEIFIMTDESSQYEKWGERLMKIGILIFAASVILYFISK